MNIYIEKIKTRLLEAEPESVVEMLYEYYREMNRPESKEISKHFSHLNDILAKLPLQEMDEVWYHICDLCIAYQKASFTDGLCIGAKLAAELETQ